MPCWSVPSNHLRKLASAWPLPGLCLASAWPLTDSAWPRGRRRLRAQVYAVKLAPDALENTAAGPSAFAASSFGPSLAARGSGALTCVLNRLRY